MNAGNMKWRMGAVIASLIFAAIALAPNFAKLPSWWKLSPNPIKYGLDIQGGLHLVMGVDVHGVIKEKLLRYGESVKTDLAKEGGKATDVKVIEGKEYDSVAITFATPDDLSKAKALISKNYYFFQELNSAENTLTLKFLDTYIAENKKTTLEQAIETIRSRIDEFGVSEPSITAQGEDRILIQLPGLKEAQKAKELINKTARLEFLIVSQDPKAKDLPKWIEEAETKGGYSLKTMKYSAYVKKINEDLKPLLPEKTRVLFQKAENTDKMELGKIPYLLETGVSLGGESVKDAFVTTGEYNEPEVAMNFNPVGAHQFEEITGNNINRLMAIILDDEVKSAPNIKTKIAGGSARITLGGARDYNAIFEEAKLIAMALRAGALPAALEQLEERTVGPSLGADSIAKGQKAAVIGAIWVILIMLVLYKASGVIAVLSLGVNVILVYALLAAVEATLTLPGIAGIALTVGMAVDANIIINERIKEELKRGVSFVAAVREGYAKAFSAIFDSNITTAGSGAILFYFGTGPVRGFAVTLIIGIITTLFANVFVSHVLTDFATGKLKLKKLSI